MTTVILYTYMVTIHLHHFELNVFKSEHTGEYSCSETFSFYKTLFVKTHKYTSSWVSEHSVMHSVSLNIICLKTKYSYVINDLRPRR